MCGINGIYNYYDWSNPIDPAQIAAMNQLLESRGPDDQGIWHSDDASISLAHRRLSIIDLSPAGKQPMISNCGQYVISFNGEIYNFKALKSSLKQKDFQSETDTEIVLALYKEKGIDFLQDLRGMFAIAIWDKQLEKLLLARDRAGQKPIYYTDQNNSFAFSSGLKSLLSLPWVEKKLNEEVLYDFLTYNQIAPPNTIFSGIKKLEPGHYLWVDKGGVKTSQAYWVPSFNRFNLNYFKSEEDLCAELRQRLKKSVEYRMLADVPVGAFLSGGVDSSAMVAYMQQMSNQAIKTYSIGFENQEDYDELKYADKVARKFGTDHHEKVVSVKDFKDFLPNVVSIFDEPLADTTSIPIYFLSALAKENGTKVIITGDGADELFGGYSNWKKYAKMHPYFSAYSALPSSLKKGIAKIAENKWQHSPYLEMLKRAEKNQDFFWSGAKGFKEATKKSYLSAGFLNRNEKTDSYQHILNLRKEFHRISSGKKLDFMSWLSFTGFKDIVPNLFLCRLDQLSMAHSVEGRSPFMDQDIIDFAMSLPMGLKIKNGQAKYLLKKALEPILDDEILYRKKMGFCVPIKEWGTEIMLEHLEEEIDICTQKFDIFKANSIKEMINQNKKGNTANTNNLWTVYFLNQWLKRWMM